MSLLNDLTAITTPALTDIVYCVQNSTDYKVTNEQLIALSKTNIIIPKTQAQYDALTPAEKNNGALYIITDAVITADDVEYSSGVSVADKIDEIIDDTTTSQDSTWSSDKISGEIGNKLDLITSSDWIYSQLTLSSNITPFGTNYIVKNDKLKLAYVHLFFRTDAVLANNDPIVPNLGISPIFAIGNIGTFSMDSQIKAYSITASGMIVASNQLASNSIFEVNAVIPFS